MHPFQLIKENQFHARLRCPACTLESWLPKLINQKCNQCGLTWNNTYLKYAKISIQYKKGEDFVTFVAGVCESACSYMAAMVKAGPILFANVAGFKAEEIFKVEFESLDIEKMDSDFKRLLARVTID